MEQQRGDRRDLVFVGVVEAIGPPPRVWGEQRGAYQEVVYRVERTLGGPPLGGLVAVRHAVVRDSPLAHPGEAPGLSATLFAPGSRLVVMAVRDGLGAWLSPSELFGAMAHSRMLEEYIRSAASSCQPTSETVDLGRSIPCGEERAKG